MGGTGPHGRLVILGSGTSFGVPVIGCTCATCTSSDPRDQRTRVSAVFAVDDGPTFLIDTPPELRLQLVRAGIGHLDAVFYTHDHADHVHGIDDLRALSVRTGRLPVYGPAEVLDRITRRFDYIFDDRLRPPAGTTRPELVPMPIEAGTPITVSGVDVLPIEADHGSMRVFGYRIGAAAYLTDVKQLPETALEALTGIEVLVLNALFDTPHPTHLSIGEAVALARRIGARRTLFTHIPHRHRHADLAARLPEGVAPAADGDVLAF